jgi:hypothetical protein
VEDLKKAIKKRGHFIESRPAEIFIGIFFFLVGALLVWDAFDGRGKKLPWPLGAIAPW